MGLTFRKAGFFNEYLCNFIGKSFVVRKKIMNVKSVIKILSHQRIRLNSSNIHLVGNLLGVNQD